MMDWTHLHLKVVTRSIVAFLDSEFAELSLTKNRRKFLLLLCSALTKGRQYQRELHHKPEVSFLIQIYSATMRGQQRFLVE